MIYELNPFERIDDLLTDGLKIIQNKKEFCFSLDAVLLAHFVNVKKKYCGVDLGTGTGVIPLLLSKKVEKIYAVELNPVMIDLAQRNVILNNLADKISVKSGDYRKIREFYPPQFADFVVVNPPYRPVRHGNINVTAGIASARHEITATLADVVKAAAYVLRFRGKFAMVHLPERLAEIIVEMNKNNIVPKRLCFVQPKKDKPPNMVLIEGVSGGAQGGLKVDTPLIVHNEDGSYTKNLLEYYYPDEFVNKNI
ncbi:tRNA1(Val) (adenine(37)-N6)-methyltransferase [Pectinatus sottacetonis]|uniref:tRNA1(Val) (adenine(37)-N6)-methyltransferase n=1 Tax=Pectinatus sottacetonis TaxID=1002795 RepID=UPI0018C571B0|nr:tRNA1(Val) (adenine(37)-N6)-methyltransferase [Pectinatus sottacetonis]